MLIITLFAKSLINQNLFLNDENRRFFLERYFNYLGGFLNTCCYSLLNNHCHFLVQVKDENSITAAINSMPPEKRTLTQNQYIEKNGTTSLDNLLERQFNSFFVSYTRSFNNLYKRKGHLFDSPFKRIFVNDESHLLQLVVYIHANAVKHRVTARIEDHAWSSYKLFLPANQLPERQKIIQLFGGSEKFIQVHKMQTDYYYKFDE